MSFPEPSVVKREDMRVSIRWIVSAIIPRMRVYIMRWNWMGTLIKREAATVR